MRQAKSLRWVHIHSAGVDRPIYAELRARGVVVTGSSGANAAIVAQTALAGWLQGLGVAVIVVRNSSQPAGELPTFTYEELRGAVSGADWLVIACPLSDRTRGLVNRDILAAMPAGAHVVNVGRGEIVVEADLIAALESGHLGGAFLDVFEHEPLPVDSPIWSLPNVIVTPHSAGLSAGNAGRVTEMFLEKLALFIEETYSLRPL